MIEDSCTTLLLNDQDKQTLLQLARNSIEHGLHQRRALEVNPTHYPEHLRELFAAFVTLKLAGELRGCIGTIEATRSLVSNVAVYAYHAAFSDSRFAPITWDELPSLNIQISMLSCPQPMTVSNEEDLLNQLRPGVDGLVLESGSRRGTFLPSVWEMLPNKHEFLSHLKRKAGIAADEWSEDMRCSRYTSFCFSADIKDLG